jgi:ATP-binding cassette subfamily B protein
MGSTKLVKPFLNKYKLLLFIYTVCVSLSYPLESIIIPKIYSKFFQNLKDNISYENFFDFFKKIIFFFVITSSASYVVSKLDIYLIPEFNESVSNIFYEKILYYYENNYTDLELGRLLTRINGLPSILREVTSDLFIWVLPKIITVVIINLYFFKHNKILGLLSLLSVSSLVYYNYTQCKKCVVLASDKYNYYETKAENLQDRLSNLYTIYSAGNIDDELNNYSEINNGYKNIHRTAMVCSSNIKYNNNISTTMIFIGLSCFIVYLYKNNKINQDNLITILMILIFYIPCLNTIITYFPEYITHLGVISSIDDYVDQICVDHQVKQNILITRGKIEIKNLTFSYNDKSNIFNNFNLTIESKDKIAIIGASGNGKSTLIKLIMGYYPVPENTIFIDDQDINLFSLSSLRKQISYINQNTKMFNKSIFENIKFGNTITNEDIMEAYNKFNLDTIFKNVDFNDSGSVNGDIYSGGQKQLILLLRIYFKKSKIVILDEPTSALDSITKETVINIIKEISQNSTLIIITHDPSNLEIVNKKIELVNGKIKE